MMSCRLVVIVALETLQAMLFHIGKNKLSLPITLFAIVLWLFVITQASLQYVPILLGSFK